MAEAPAAADPVGTNLWLLRLVPPGRWGRWLAGVSIFTLIFGVFAVFGGLFDDTLRDRLDTWVALFFATLLAYIVPVHHLIIQRSLTALEMLRPLLPGDGDSVDRYRRQILVKPVKQHLTVLLVGLCAGLAHNSLLLDEGELVLALMLPASLLSLIITLAIWIVMTATISSLIENAVLFKRLAERVRIDVLNTRALTPFGSVAVSSTLAMIGAQAAFPLLIAGSDSHWITFMPGLIATGVPMIFLFLLPVVPVHRRVTRAKQSKLAAVNADITAQADAPESGYASLEPLLVYRREVLDAPEWPFDTGALGRLALYLIIPPLTWIGAALIEILVDTAI